MLGADVADDQIVYSVLENRISPDFLGIAETAASFTANSSYVLYSKPIADRYKLASTKNCRQMALKNDSLNNSLMILAILASYDFLHLADSTAAAQGCRLSQVLHVDRGAPGTLCQWQLLLATHVVVGQY